MATFIVVRKAGGVSASDAGWATLSSDTTCPGWGGGCGLCRPAKSNTQHSLTLRHSVLEGRMCATGVLLQDGCIHQSRQPPQLAPTFTLLFHPFVSPFHRFVQRLAWAVIQTQYLSWRCLFSHRLKVGQRSASLPVNPTWHCMLLLAGLHTFFD